MPTDQISDLVPTTELEAINAMLEDAGESSVENLTAPLQANVERALSIIRRLSRGVQSRGWHFNTVRNTVLTRDDNDGYSIAAPDNALRIRKTVSDEQRTFDFSHRQNGLWNNLTNSDSFDGDEYVNGVRVDITYALDFTDLPEVARQLIVIMSARRYQEKTLGNADLSEFSSKDEALALQNLIDAEGLLEDTNSLTSFKDEAKATEIFNTVSKQVQSEGWKFNTRKEFTIAVDSEGKLVLPGVTLRVSKSLTKANSPLDLNVSNRGSYLYDAKNNTYDFDDTNLPNGEIYVDLVEYLDREELPQSAIRYIEIKAARQLQPQKQNGAPKQGYTERDEFLARQALVDDQGLVDDDNLLDSMDTYRIVYNRTSFTS